MARPGVRAAGVVISVFAGGAAVLADAHPTGVGALDAALRATLAATLTAARASGRPPGLVAAATAAFAATLWSTRLAPQVAAAAGVALMLLGWSPRSTGTVARCTSAAVTVNVALRLGGGPFHGASALAAAGVVALLAWAGTSTLPRRSRTRLALGAAVALGAVGAAALLAAGPALTARPELLRAVDDVTAGTDALRAANPDEAASHFDRAARRFERAGTALGAWWTRPGRAVPVVGQNARAIEDLAELGRSLAGTAARTARAASIEQARPRDGAVDLDAVRALEPPLAQTHLALEAAHRAARAIDSPWLLPPVRDEVDTLRSRMRQALPHTRDALAAARLAPALLGGGEPRRYFIAFTTPAEARASGGFIGNYGELTARNGELELSAFGRIAELNEPGRRPRVLTGPADYVSRYARFDIANHFQDVTFSPDFPSVARVIEGLYPQATGRQVDGVISVDPIALAALLELTGPVEVPQLDEQLSSANAERILLRDQYVLFARDGGRRVDFLESAARAVFERITTATLPEPQTIARVLAPAVRQGRLKLHSVHPQEQAFFEQAGLAGAFPPVEGDFLGVVTQNAGRSKIDAFLHRAVRYEATVEATAGAQTAEVRATLEVELRNDVPPGLPAAIAGDVSGPGVNRAYVSIYTPLGLDGASFDGAPVGMESSRELGRSAYSLYVEVPPGSARTLRLELAGLVDIGAGAELYRLTLAHQPLANADAVRVTVRSPSGDVAFSRELMLREDARLAAPGEWASDGGS